MKPGTTAAELARRARMDTNFDGMRRWGFESPPGNAFEAFYDAPIDAVKRLFQ